MPKKVKKGKDRQDKFYYLAKEQGYRSRAAFKLIQLNKKYSFLETTRVLVDLCSAPGGWLQVARKVMPIAGQIFGIDLASVKPIPHVTSIVGDITTKKSIKQLKHEMRGQQADVVLCDGSPNVGANWLKDAYTQSELILAATKFAADVLIPGGLFITKVFRSKDYNSLLWVFSKLFKKVEATKPAATRHTSAEIYVVCQGYLAPKTIDPKLFDPKFIFEDTEPEKKPDFGFKKKKRNREGYADGDYLLNKRGTVTGYIDCDKPLSMLAEYNQLLWDEEAVAKYGSHPATTNEVKLLLDDLKVIGRMDFRLLLKWRVTMREVRDETGYNSDDASTDGEEEDVMAEASTSAGADGEDFSPEAKDERDEVTMIEELEALRRKADKAKKNALKKRKVRVAKLQPRGDTLTEKPSDINDLADEGSLFSILQIRNQQALNSVLSAKSNLQADGYEEGDDDEDDDGSPDEREDEDIDYDDMLEKQLDNMYEKYLDSRKVSQVKSIAKRRNEARKERDDLFRDVDGDSVKMNKADIDFDDEDLNPLLVDLSDKPVSGGGAAQKSKMWFSQPIFDVLKGKTPSASTSAASTSKAASAKKRKRDEDDDSEAAASDDDAASDTDSEEEYAGLKPQAEKEGYEEVPQEMYDSDTRANTLALATKMLRKKSRRDIVDAAYNRYTFGDEDVPKWFADDEVLHNKPMVPITKEEVRKIKERFREISERPIKKVLEAQLRKKVKATQKLTSMKDKATEVAANTELTAKDKAKALAGLLKKAKAKPKTEKTYVVSKKGISKAMPNRNRNSVIKRVDPRMKKEARAKKRARKA